MLVELSPQTVRLGLMQVSEYRRNHLRELYLVDSRPWLVGYSGGKPPLFTTKSRRTPRPASSFIPHPSAFPSECPIQIDTSTPSCGHSRFGMKRQNVNREWTRMIANVGSHECRSEPVGASLSFMA